MDTQKTDGIDGVVFTHRMYEPKTLLASLAIRRGVVDNILPGEIAFLHGQKIHPNEMVQVIAITGNVDDWAGYAGWEHLTDEEIARTGAKISEELARKLFPYFPYLKYRR